MKPGINLDDNSSRRHVSSPPFQRRRRSREDGFRRETSLQSDSESEQKRTFTRICVDFRHPVVLFSLPYSWRGVRCHAFMYTRVYMHCARALPENNLSSKTSRIYRNFMRDYKIPLIIHIYHKHAISIRDIL